MGTSRSRFAHAVTCLGVVITTLLAALSAQAEDNGVFTDSDRPRLNLPLNIAVKSQSCSPRALRGENGPAGTLDVAITLRCAHNWALKARAWSDRAAANGEPEPAPLKAPLLTLHVGRNRVMFMIGTKW